MAASNDDPLARPFDVVVLGTGLVESIVAAAAARAGKRVLHMDAAQFYGGDAASLPISQWADWASARVTDDVTGGAGVQAAPLPGERRLFIRPSPRAHGPPPPLPEGIARLSRRFTLDAGPRFVLARGAMADLMVTSGVAGYMDFRAVDGAFVVDAAADGRRLELVKVREARAYLRDCLLATAAVGKAASDQRLLAHSVPGLSRCLSAGARQQGRRLCASAALAAGQAPAHEVSAGAGTLLG
jgi:hypothetical protein